VMDRRMELPRYPGCFVCGDSGENPAALGLRCFFEDGVVQASFVPREEHAGYPGIVHGGILASLLDEVSIWAASMAAQALCVTRSLKVEYLRPAKVGKTVEIRAWVVGREGRFLRVQALVEGPNGEVLARSEGSFFPRFRREWARLFRPLKETWEG